MNLEVFQRLDNEPFDNSILIKDYLRVYHQQGANLNDSDQHAEFMFGENNNYHQLGNAYLEYDLTVQHPTAALDNISRIRITNKGLAYVFEEAVWGTTSGSNLYYNKFEGQISTIMRVLTSKDGDLLSQFDIINKCKTDNDFDSTSFKKCSLIIILLPARKLINVKLKVNYR